MSDTIKYRFRLRRRLAAAWAALNEILLDSEIGLASDSRELKVGDGETAWNDLDPLEAGMQLGRMGDVNTAARADGLSLVWDETAGKHVYEAGGVSHHGALTGLADDDHPQYALVSMLSETIDDRVVGLLVEGGGTSITYDDAANALTIASTGWGGDIPDFLVDFAMFFPDKPTNSQLMAKYVATRDLTLAANLSGSYGHIGVLPTATTTVDVKRNGTSIGTVSISTAGAFTFTTTSGTAKDLVAGDRMELYGQSSADATAADFGVTLVAGRSDNAEIDFGGFFPGTPASNQLIMVHVLARSASMLANFGGAYGHIGTNPTSSFVATVWKNSTQIGTVTVSTGGAFTFATIGGVTVSLAAGDVIEVVAPSSADATAANIAFTFKAAI
jgi:hypothetical protein